MELQSDTHLWVLQQKPRRPTQVEDGDYMLTTSTQTPCWQTSRLMIKIIEYHSVTAILSDQKKVHELLVAAVCQTAHFFRSGTLSSSFCIIYLFIHPSIPPTHKYWDQHQSRGAWPRTKKPDLRELAFQGEEIVTLTSEKVNTHIFLSG